MNCEKRAGPNADNDGKHHHLDAGGDDVAEYLFGKESGPAEEREGDQHEAGQRRQLELDQCDEELDGKDEEGDQDDQPGDEQDRDLDEILQRSW